MEKHVISITTPEKREQSLKKVCSSPFGHPKGTVVELPFTIGCYNLRGTSNNEIYTSIHNTLIRHCEVIDNHAHLSLNAKEDMMKQLGFDKQTISETQILFDFLGFNMESVFY